MIIFRTYKTDNKIVSYAKQHKGTECYSPFLEEGSLSMEKLRAKTTKLLIDAIESNMFSDRVKKKIISTNPEVLLQMESSIMEEYSFDLAFRPSVDELTGRTTVRLPVPANMPTEAEYAKSVRAQMPHE